MSEPPTPSMAYFDVLNACREAGCPICRLSWRASENYLDATLYENVNDPGVQAQLRAARGYCHRHAWRLPEGSGRSLGIALLQRAVLQEVIGVLNDGPSVTQTLRRRWNGTDRAGSLAAALDPQQTCPACEQAATAEHIAFSELIKHLPDPAFIEAFQHSAGLCLPHFRQALREASDDTLGQRLIDLQRPHFERLCDQLAEFIRKNDYRFASEGYGVEGDSWLRAIALVSGAQEEH